MDTSYVENNRHNTSVHYATGRIPRKPPKPLPRKSRQVDGQHPDYDFVPSANDNQSIQGTFRRSDRYYRSYSHPEDSRRTQNDINKSIHDEIISSPWEAASQRRSKRRDRYALYIPAHDVQTFDPLGLYYDNECFEDIPKAPPSHVFQTQDYTRDIYGTYRRAPPTYPRIDVRNTFDNKHPSNNDINNAARTTDYETTFPKVFNGELNNRESYLDVTQCRSYQQNMERTAVPSINHVFTRKLNNVITTQNMTSPTPSQTANNTSENPEGTNSQCESFKDKCKRVCSKAMCSNCCLKKLWSKVKRNNNSQRRRRASAGNEKPFFYCRWIAEYPKSMFGK